MSAAGSGGSLLVPELSSRPGAAAKVWLDFDGDITPIWASYLPGETPAFSVDPDTTTFSTADLDAIHKIFTAVAESYSPFEVNITTVPPTIFETRFVQLRIGGAGGWYPARVGGLAWQSSYQVNFLPTGGFIFSDNLLPNDPLFPSFVAAAATHEAGHTFGLAHQSAYAPDGSLIDPYNRGDTEKAPFMGASYRKRGLWWLGPTESGSTSIQDDLAKLSGPANGFGYRADDHGNLPGSATPMSQGGSIFAGAGVIERNTDVDYFSFVSPADGDVLLRLDVASYGAMLDGSLALYNLGGQLLQLADTPTLGEQFLRNLPAGEYRLAVSSHGGYGDIGQYTVSALFGQAVPEPAAVLAAGAGGAVFGLRRRRFA